LFANDKLSPNQFLLLVLLYTVGSSILFIPNTITQLAHRDGWISSFLGIGIGLIISWFYTNVASLKKDVTIVGLSELVFGKWVGGCLSILYCSFLFILTGLVVQNIVGYITTTFLVETPPLAIYGLFYFVVAIGVRCGIETIGRCVQVLFILMFGLYLVAMFGLTPKLDFHLVQPILENGPKPVLRSLVPLIGSPYVELVTFLMIYSSVPEGKTKRKAFINGAVLGALFLAVPACFCLLIIGPDLTANTAYPAFYVTKLIRIGDFFQRVEVFLAIIVYLTVFIKAVVCFYALNKAIVELFQLTDKKVLTLPLTLLCMVFSSIAYPTAVYGLNFIQTTWTPYAVTIGFVFPLSLWIGWFVRTKWGKKGAM